MDTTRPRTHHLVAHSVLTVVGMTGIAGVFLPFAYDYSPVRAAFDEELWRLALPFYLSPLALAGSIRWIRFRFFSRLERGIAYVVSAATTAVTLSGYVDGRASSPAGIQDWVSFLAPLAVLGVGICCLIRNSKAVFREFNAVMAMQMPYLANALGCLVGLFGEWQIGAYLTLIATMMFVVQIFLIFAESRGHSGPRTPSAAESRQ